jgi:hypothetical protein
VGAAWAWGTAAAVAVIGTGAVDRAGNARLLSMEACGRDAGAAGGSLVNHRMRRKTRCVRVMLRGHHQLREARNHGEATANGARPVSRDASRKTPRGSETGLSHWVRLWNDS